MKRTMSDTIIGVGVVIIGVLVGFVCDYLHQAAFYKRAQAQSVLKHAGFIIELEDKNEQG